MVKTLLLNKINEYKEKGTPLVHLASIQDINMLKDLDCQINIGDKKVEVMCSQFDACNHHLDFTEKPFLLSLSVEKVNQLLSLNK